MKEYKFLIRILTKICTPFATEKQMGEEKPEISSIEQIVQKLQDADLCYRIYSDLQITELYGKNDWRDSAVLSQSGIKEGIGIVRTTNSSVLLPTING
ncbi:hypothetical protein SLA2020_202370 [Shorea laevis]